MNFLHFFTYAEELCYDLHQALKMWRSCGLPDTLPTLELTRISFYYIFLLSLEKKFPLSLSAITVVYRI